MYCVPTKYSSKYSRFFVSRVLITVVAALLLASCASTVTQDSNQYERIKVESPSLQGNLSGDDHVRDVSVYLPPSYHANRAKRFPVLYLLHGFTRTDEFWFGMSENSYVDADEAMDEAWANGAMEMIIVVPNGYNRFAGSMYSSSVTTGDWEGFIAVDLVDYIDDHYRTLAVRESRGLGGHSMGGYGTLRIGMKYPEVFSSLYAMSPCCMAANLAPSQAMMAQLAQIQNDEQVAEANFGLKAALASAAAWSPNPNNPPFYFDLPIIDGELQPEVISMWAANAPLSMVHQYLPALREYTAIYMDAGDGDVAINATVHALSDIFDDYGLQHVAEEYQGDHTNRVHQRLVENVIPMFSRTLEEE